MVTQEAKELVEQCGLNIEGNKHAECEKIVISALEKQIPRKPVPTPQPCKSRFACSICDKRIYSKQKFCDRCGQALDWSDTK
jgi:hypothetical protein